MKLLTGWRRPSSPSKRAILLLRLVLLALRRRSNILDEGLAMLDRLKSIKLLAAGKACRKADELFPVVQPNRLIPRASKFSETGWL